MGWSMFRRCVCVLQVDLLVSVMNGLIDVCLDAGPSVRTADSHVDMDTKK